MAATFNNISSTGATVSPAVRGGQGLSASPLKGDSDAPPLISLYQIIKAAALDMITVIQFQNTTVSTTNELSQVGSKFMGIMKEESADLGRSTAILEDLNWALMATSVVTIGLGVAATTLFASTAPIIGVATQTAGNVATAAVTIPTSTIEVRQGQDKGNLDVIQGVMQSVNQRIKSTGDTTSQTTQAQNGIGSTIAAFVRNESSAQLNNKR